MNDTELEARLRALAPPAAPAPDAWLERALEERVPAGRGRVLLAAAGLLAAALPWIPLSRGAAAWNTGLVRRSLELSEACLDRLRR